MKIKFILGLFLFATTACNENREFKENAIFERIESLRTGFEIDPDTTKNYEAIVSY
jgi:hypothetical protein